MGKFWKERIFEFKVEPGYKPAILNPRASIPYRNLVLGALGWDLSAEVYGPLPLIGCNVFNGTSVVDSFEGMLRRYPDHYVVWCQTNRGMVGGIGFQSPSPLNFAPKAHLIRESS